MFIVGLTGGIGSGKTAASDKFESLGITVVDADVVAREVVEPGTPALKEIIARFGPSIVDDEGNLDRSRLRQIIFAEPAEKIWLEKLLHPVIRSEIHRQLQSSTSAYSILVSPLLFETDQNKMVSRTLLIDALKETQIERASGRDQSSKEQIKAIIDTQMSREKKRELADDIIMNESSKEALEDAVYGLHRKYLEFANEQNPT